MNKITTVKELPDSEKPYEKFLTYGPEYLSDAELLAVIIRSGTSGLKSVQSALIIPQYILTGLPLWDQFHVFSASFQTECHRGLTNCDDRLYVRQQMPHER